MMLRRMMSAQADLHRKWLESVSTRQRCQSFRRAIGTAASHAWNLVAVLSIFDGAVTRCVFLQTVCFEQITTPLSVETRPCFFGNSGLITCLHLHDQQTLVQAFKSATILEKLSNSSVCSQCLWTISDFIDVPRILFWYCLHTWFNLDCFHRIFILILSSHV